MEYRFRMTQSSTRLIAYIFVVTAIIWILLILTAGSPKKQEAQQRIPNVEYTSANYKQQPEMIVVYAKVRALSPTAVDGEINAKIKSLNVENGSSVKKGDVIATFDTTDLKIEKSSLEESIAQFRSRIKSTQDQIESLSSVIQQDEQLLENAQDLLTRYQKLSPRFQSQQTLTEKKDLVSQRTKTLQQNQSKIQDLEHQLDQQKKALAQEEYANLNKQLDLEQTELKAPRDGIITGLKLISGDYLKKGEEFVTIIDPSKTFLHAFIPSQYYSRLVPDMIGHLKDNPASTLTLNNFDHIVKDKSTHIDTRFYFDTPAKSQYAIGQIVALTIELPLPQPTVVVPESSIYQNGLIYKIIDNHLEQINISILGLSYQPDATSYLIYNSNLKDGDKILTTRLTWPKTGLSVKADG